MKTRTFVGFVPSRESLVTTLSQAVSNPMSSKKRARIYPRLGMEKSKKECLEVGYGFRKVVRRTITITVNDEEV